MKTTTTATTTVFCIFCTLFLSANALETVLIGDFISEPTINRFTGWGSPKAAFSDLRDGGTEHFFGAAMGPNGNGLLAKYVDPDTWRTTTGSLILKNSDGSYRTVDLPFNCSSRPRSAVSRSATTNGRMFVCGNTLFELGPNDSAQNIQTLGTNFQNGGYFASDSILFGTGSTLTIFSNLTTGVWELQSSLMLWGTLTYPPLSTHTVSTVRVVSDQVTITPSEHYGDATSWTALDPLIIPLNSTAVPISDKDSALWDGGNTIIVGLHMGRVGINTVSGEIKIFRKQNNAWGLHKVITSEDLGLPAPGGLGIGLYLLDQDTFIVHAVGGYNRSRYLHGGMAFALEKISNDWVITTKFVQQNNDEAYLVGALNYDKSDGRLYFTACRTKVVEKRRFYRECGIKYGVWDRTKK